MYILGFFCKKRSILWKSLKDIFGINSSLSRRLCAKMGFSTKSLVLEVERRDLQFITYYVLGRFSIGNAVKAQKFQKAQQYRVLRLLKGIRLRKGLPINGQRTRNNGLTARKLNGRLLGVIK